MIILRKGVKGSYRNNDSTWLMVNFIQLKNVSFQCIAESVGFEDETLIKSLIDLADAVPKFLKGQLETIFNLCLKVSTVINILKNID